MVVRFPSEASDSGSEHVAPVTPLRRAGARRDRAVERGLVEQGVVRPVAELPGAQEVAAPADGGSSERWNNTWAAEPARRSGARDVSDTADASHTAYAPSTADASGTEDEESERLARKASGVTIRQLARRGMSRWELEQLLTKREIAAEVYGPEFDRLEAMGVIDDASLAATLAFTQHSRKGLGRSAIELDLKRRHIAPELIEEALADIADEDELERATELAVKRIGQLSSYDDETARRRLHGFLARKGYDSSVVRQAMDAAFATRGRRGGVRFQ